MEERVLDACRLRYQCSDQVGLALGVFRAGHGVVYVLDYVFEIDIMS